MVRGLVANSGREGPEQKRHPREKGDEENWDIKPERLDVLECRSEVALEVVLDDEDAEEVWIAAGAKDVPGQSGEAEGGDGGGMKQPEGVVPTFGERSPEKDGAANQNDSSRTFGEHRESEEKAEE